MLPHFKVCSTGVLHVKNISSCVRLSVCCQSFWMSISQKWKPLKGSCNLFPPIYLLLLYYFFTILSHSKPSTENLPLSFLRWKVKKKCERGNPGKITRYLTAVKINQFGYRVDVISILKLELCYILLIYEYLRIILKLVCARRSVLW